MRAGVLSHCISLVLAAPLSVPGFSYLFKIIFQEFKYVSGWVGGWMDGWVDGWVNIGKSDEVLKLENRN